MQEPCLSECFLRNGFLWELTKYLMSESQKLFFDLLLVCTVAKTTLRQSYTEVQWNEALMLALEQRLLINWR